MFNFFSRGHQRSINAKRNIAASFVVRGVSIAVSFLLVPMTIGYVNPTRYGIWLTLSSVIAWFSFFDIGFSNSLRNRFAEAKAAGNNDQARAYISTIYASLGIIFFTVWALFMVVNQFLDWTAILNTPPEMGSELSSLALIVVSFFCIQIVLKTISTVIIADQKPAKSAFYDMIGQVLTLLIVFVLTKYTQHSLLYLGLAVGISPVAVLMIASAVLYRTEYRHYAPSISFVDFRLIADILDLGLKFFIIQIAAIVIYQTNNIVISQVCGPQDVTVYNIAYKYFGVLTMAFSIVLAPFWSAYTEAKILADYQWMNNILKKLVRAWLGLSVAAGVLLVISPLVYHVWVRDAVTVPFSVSAAVFMYVVIFNWCAIYSQILAGLGKIKLMLYSAIFGCLVNIPFAVVLGKEWGIVGIVSASALLSIISAIWSPIQVKLLLQQKAKGIWNQ
jgi:O-antigen/teichoic acid export membrane protein